MSIDDAVADKVREVTREDGHDLTERAVRSVAREEIAPVAARVAALESGRPDPDPDPDPGLALLPDSAIRFSIDPLRPETYGPERTNRSQIRTAGGWTNFRNGPNDPRRILGNHRLHWVGNSLHSSEMQDRTTLRAGPTTIDGRPFFVFAGQWTGKGYPDNVDSSPGENDPMLGDGGPRGDAAQIDGHVKVGSPAGPGDMMAYWHIGIAQPGDWAKQHTAGPFGLHAPLDAAQSGPVTTSTNDGEIIAWSKTTGPVTTARGQGSPLAFPGAQPLGPDHITLGRYQLGEPGRVFAFLFIAQVDKSDGPYGFWLYDVPLPTGEPRLIRAYDGPRFGYYYANEAKNREFYPIIGSTYTPHKWWPPERYPASPWNWVNSTPDGDVRRRVFRLAEFTAGPTVPRAGEIAKHMQARWAIVA